jgi:zinc finger protein-like protein
MLDRLLLNETMPEELAAKTQAIHCNDCGGNATVAYHFVYHKCPSCSSYNTRVH